MFKSRLINLPGFLFLVKLFVEEPHLVSNNPNMPVLILNLKLQVFAVLLLGMQAIQNLGVANITIMISLKTFEINQQNALTNI